MLIFGWNMAGRIPLSIFTLWGHAKNLFIALAVDIDGRMPGAILP